MPSILDPATPVPLGSPSLGDDEIRQLKQFLADLWGLPVSPSQIITPIGGTSTSGIFHFNQGLEFLNLGPNPSINQLQMYNGRLVYNNGIVQNLLYLSDYSGIKDVTEPHCTNTVAETSLYYENIDGGSLQTNNFMHGQVDFFISSMIATGTLQLKLYFGGFNFLGPTIFNGTAFTQIFSATIKFRINARGATGVQWASASIEIPAADNALNLGATGLFSNMAAAVPLAVDSTIDQPLQVNAVWNTADVANSVYGVGLDIFKVV